MNIPSHNKANYTRTNFLGRGTRYLGTTKPWSSLLSYICPNWENFHWLRNILCTDKWFQNVNLYQGFILEPYARLSFGTWEKFQSRAFFFNRTQEILNKVKLNCLYSLVHEKKLTCQGWNLAKAVAGKAMWPWNLPSVEWNAFWRYGLIVSINSERRERVLLQLWCERLVIWANSTRDADHVLKWASSWIFYLEKFSLSYSVLSIKKPSLFSPLWLVFVVTGSLKLSHKPICQ